jgi:glycosyltransferase involved in cell wall biosynthesis
LLIQALKFVTRPIRVLIAGQGGLMAHYEQHIRQAGLEDRVRLLGRIDTYELLAGYARCLGVFFGPRDEDYGYVTLEAMLASKPVITCTDSGGPLEFVEHGHNGLICQPEPRAVAEALDRLAADWQEARAMGRRGRDRYRELNISWDRVVRELLG